MFEIKSLNELGVFCLEEKYLYPFSEEKKENLANDLT